jgi:hypothetical protein
MSPHPPHHQSNINVSGSNAQINNRVLIIALWLQCNVIIVRVMAFRFNKEVKLNEEWNSFQKFIVKQLSGTVLLNKYSGIIILTTIKSGFLPNMTHDMNLTMTNIPSVTENASIIHFQTEIRSMNDEETSECERTFCGRVFSLQCEVPIANANDQDEHIIFFCSNKTILIQRH